MSRRWVRRGGVLVPSRPGIFEPSEPSEPEPQPGETFSFHRKFFVKDGVIPSGWELAERPLQPGEGPGEEEIIVRADHLECYAGGFPANSHFARIVRNFPARDNFYVDCTSPAGEFNMLAEFVLPTNYYEQSEGFLRWVNTDNYPSIMRDTGVKVGALDADEWRVGFGIVSATTKYPVLMSYHEAQSPKQDMNLWSGSSRLPVGRNLVKVRFIPNTKGQLNGGYDLTVNGTMVDSKRGIQTIPDTVENSERKVTSLFAGIDGAYAQDTRRLRVDLFSAELQVA